MDVTEAWSRTWISDDGLMRLDPYPEDSRIGPTGVETVRNENGILWLVAHAFMLELAGVSIESKKEHFEKTIDSLARVGYLGLFNRHPWGTKKPDRHEAHDNYAAICAISVRFNLAYPRYILAFGERNAFMYNNVEPNKFEIKQQRQPGEIAFYRFCSGVPIPFWEYLWWIGGIISNAFRHNDSETHLCWVRLRAVKLGEKGWWSKLQKFIFEMTVEFWLFKKRRQYPDGLIGVVRHFYKYYHPIHEWAKFVSVHTWGVK